MTSFFCMRCNRHIAGPGWHGPECDLGSAKAAETATLPGVQPVDNAAQPDEEREWSDLFRSWLPAMFPNATTTRVDAAANELSKAVLARLAASPLKEVGDDTKRLDFLEAHAQRHCCQSWSNRHEFNEHSLSWRGPYGTDFTGASVREAIDACLLSDRGLTQ
jgi:hypothetical protein